MMAPTAPLIQAPMETCRNNSVASSRPELGCFTRRRAVICVSLVELLFSMAVMSVYIYALIVRPSWYPILVPIPNDLCNAADVVRGVMYIIVLLCILETLMALYLFVAARREKLDRARCWLSCMLTYLTLVTVVILGFDLGGIRCPSMNSAAFINIFFRFMEILCVYAWVEQENLLRTVRLARGGRREHGSQARSTLTICTLASAPGGLEREEPAAAADPEGQQTPPPSYSDTIPSRSFQQQQVVSSHYPALSTTPLLPQEEQ